MALKRKRSMIEDSPIPASTLSALSPASSTSPSSERNHDHAMTSPNPRFQLSPTTHHNAQNETYQQHPRLLLNSRTRKRWRNDRPADEDVYSNTLFKLFDAQRHLRESTPPTHTSTAQSSSFQQTQDIRPQASLNAFLSLPGPSMVMPTARWNEDSGGTVHCEECGRGVVSGHDMPMDNMDQRMTDGCWCQGCGRPVCDTCAVTRDMRLCLSCDLNSS